MNQFEPGIHHVSQIDPQTKILSPQTPDRSTIKQLQPRLDSPAEELIYFLKKQIGAAIQARTGT